MGNLSAFIKYHRKKLRLSQEELASKAGVGLRFMREMEQGKETLQMDKVNQVLALFGFELTPDRMQINPYEIIYKYFNIAVKITFKNKLVKFGIIIDEITDIEERKITAWRFVPNNHAINFQNKPDETLVERIEHKDILSIEKQ